MTFTELGYHRAIIIDILLNLLVKIVRRLSRDDHHIYELIFGIMLRSLDFTLLFHLFFDIIGVEVRMDGIVESIHCMIINSNNLSIFHIYTKLEFIRIPVELVLNELSRSLIIIMTKDDPFLESHRFMDLCLQTHLVGDLGGISFNLGV